MSENNIPCIQLIGDKEDFSRWAEAEVLPYEGQDMLDPALAIEVGRHGAEIQPSCTLTPLGEMVVRFVLDDAAVEKLERLIKEYRIIKHIKENK